MKMKKQFHILAFLLTISVGLFAQEKSRILLLNGTLHVGNGQIMNSAAIGIEKGKIKLVLNSLAYSYKKEEWDTIIDLKNQHVYPGFVAPNSTLGLTEIDAVRATNDFNEVGDMNPHIRSLIAFNVESKVIATVKTNGVLITQATPRGGAISGSSSLLLMDGWNWEDAVIKADDGIHVNWPSSIQGEGWGGSASDIKQNENYRKQLETYSQFFGAAKLYASGEQKDLDLRFNAMTGIFKGTQRVYFHANDVQQLLDIIEFAKKHEIKFPVIVGGYDAYLIPERIRDSKIPIMLPRVHSLPRNEDDPVDLPYKLPSLLYKAGIKFCLQNEGDMEAMNARNLPFLAGTAMAHGLPDEEAVKSISLNTCEIVGIDKEYGSVEVGKKATLFVSTGSALDMKTNNVTLILINGTFSSTSNSQRELYIKYSKKLGLLF